MLLPGRSICFLNPVSCGNCRNGFVFRIKIKYNKEHDVKRRKGINGMEGNRHIDRTDAVVRPVFQKEGNVYVRGKSGSGKTTLLLERLQFLAQEGWR